MNVRSTMTTLLAAGLLLAPLATALPVLPGLGDIDTPDTLCIPLNTGVVQCVKLPPIAEDPLPPVDPCRFLLPVFGGCPDIPDTPVPPELPPVLPPVKPTDPCPPRAAASVLCPTPYAPAACVGVGLAVVLRTPVTSDIIAAEGTSRADAWAYGPGSFSQSSASGALADVSALGLARADTLQSDCRATAWTSWGLPYGYATSHAEAQGVDVLSLLRVTVLDDDSSVSTGQVVGPTQGRVVELCAPACNSYGTAQNFVVPIMSGVYAILNERGTSSYHGHTLTWGAAVHIVVAPTGNPGLDIYVGYTAAAA